MAGDGGGVPLLEATHGQVVLPNAAVRRKLLLSHTITRMGTQGWLFVAPLILQRFMPGTIVGPALWGMCTMLATMVLGPKLGSWADRSNRRSVVILGVVLQALAVLGATAVVVAVSAAGTEITDNASVFALTLFIFFGVVEKLGLVLSDTSVKREWAPRLLQDEMLRATNQAMSQIDLLTEVFGPFIAGLLVSVPAYCGWSPPGLPLQPVDVGFVAVGVLNALTFWPQLALLLAIYKGREAQLQPSINAAPSRSGPLPTSGSWSAWWHHPGGIQLLGLSYAMLYLTVLSPHGALLTAFLMDFGVPAWDLSLLRGLGALLGVGGVALRPALGRCIGEYKADALCVAFLGACTLSALVTFRVAAAAAHADGMSAAAPGLVAFMLLVCLGRPGLYAFELGVLNTEQELADARHRTSIGAVDGAMTSGGTLVMYAAGLLLNRSEEFGYLVAASAYFVSGGTLVYLFWMVCFHAHVHKHSGEHGHGHGHSHADAHGHGHGDAENHGHAHTQQQLESLRESPDGTHLHIHYHPPNCTIL